MLRGRVCSSSALEDLLAMPTKVVRMGKIATLESAGTGKDARREKRRRELEAALDRISVTAYEIVQAPRDPITGTYDLQRAKKKAGLGLYFGTLCSPLDFWGECVAMASILPQALRGEAYSSRSASGCIAFAKRLEHAVAAYLSDGRRVSIADELTSVGAAIRWLRFWGGNGFGYSSWY